jgi:hypothetical protein
LRSWRAVHWLAYASWPVALVHSLGTGSDARVGWLTVVGVSCTGAVVLTVFWRVAAATDGPAPVRIGATLASFAVPLGILIWASGGPLGKGWAARAGTPPSLLASARVAAARAAAASSSSRSGPPTTATAPVPTLPSGPFDAGFQGRLTQTPAGHGLVTVAIDGVASGGFSGRVHIALRGVALAGGGVQMIDSSVGLLPSGASSWYAGRVVALEGQQIFADVQGAGGQRVRIQLALQIDPASGSVSGSIHSVRGGDEQSGRPSE